MKLHDRTRRSLSLLIFFLLGPMLAIGILVASGLRRMPSHARNFEYQATLRTGLHLEIGAVEYRSPNHIRLKSVRMIDDAALTAVFEAPEVDLQYIRTSAPERIFPGLENPQSTPGFWQLTVPVSVLKLEHYTSAASASLFQDLLRKLTARSNLLAEIPTLVIFEDVGVFCRLDRTGRGGEDSKAERFRFIKGTFHKIAGATLSRWTFQIPGVSEFETQKLSIVQAHQTRAVEMEWDTGTGMIPCDLAALFCPVFQACTPGSRFSGNVSVLFPNDGVLGQRVTLRDARFENLQLAPFASEYTPFIVRGTVADLRIAAARFDRDHFFLEGCVNVTDGTLEKTLFHRLVDRFSLDVKPGTLLESAEKTVPFDSMALHFRLDTEGALFRPDENWKGNLMFRRGDGIRTTTMNVLFPEGQPRPISYHTLLSTLAPATAPIVPWTTLSQRIFSMLPAESFSEPTPRHPDSGTPENRRRELLAVEPSGTAETGSIVLRAREELTGTQSGHPPPTRARPAPPIANRVQVQKATPGKPPEDDYRSLLPSDSFVPPSARFHTPGRATSPSSALGHSSPRIVENFHRAGNAVHSPLQ